MYAESLEAAVNRVGACSSAASRPGTAPEAAARSHVEGCNVGALATSPQRQSTRNRTPRRVTEGDRRLWEASDPEDKQREKKGEAKEQLQILKAISGLSPGALEALEGGTLAMERARLLRAQTHERQWLENALHNQLDGLMHLEKKNWYSMQTENNADVERIREAAEAARKIKFLKRNALRRRSRRNRGPRKGRGTSGKTQLQFFDKRERSLSGRRTRRRERSGKPMRDKCWRRSVGPPRRMLSCGRRL